MTCVIHESIRVTNRGYWNVQVSAVSLANPNGKQKFKDLGCELAKEVITAVVEKCQNRVCLDQGFVNNDWLKTNAVRIMKSKGVDGFRTVQQKGGKWHISYISRKFYKGKGLIRGLKVFP